MTDAHPTGLIVGTSLLDADFFQSLETSTVNTRWEPVTVHESDGLVAIQRHDSPDGYRPPHKINHKANIQALLKLGIEQIFSVQSTGSLDESIPTGSFVVPHDMINLWNVASYHDDERAHGVSEFDQELRQRVIETVSQTDEEVLGEGIYAQTLGPRFETPAEANLLADYADIVGMTAASELTIACELGIRYVSLCSVDNYVNGIAGTEVSMEAFEEAVADNVPTVEKLVTRVLNDTFNIELD